MHIEITRYAIGVLFSLAGIAKIVGARALKDQFTEFGLQGWVMRFVGILEVAGGIGLLGNVLPFWASAGLSVLMLGAVSNHLKIKHGFYKVLPSALLLVASALLAYWLGGPGT